MNILRLPQRDGGRYVVTFGEFLKSEMQKRDMNLSEFSRFLGLAHNTVAKYLDYPKEGVGYPDIAALVKISRALNVDLGTLVNIVEPSQARISPSILLLAERISRLSEDKQELVDALILGLALKGADKN